MQEIRESRSRSVRIIGTNSRGVLCIDYSRFDFFLPLECWFSYSDICFANYLAYDVNLFFFANSFVLIIDILYPYKNWFMEI
jgi:hypothetical protein